MRLSMTRTQQAELQSIQAELSAELARSDLGPEQRAELQRHAYAVAGVLLSPLLPVGISRKASMALFVIVAISGTLQGDPWFLVLLLVAASFSPYIVGRTAFTVERISGAFSDGYGRGKTPG
jgi:hypothetical protein